MAKVKKKRVNIARYDSKNGIHQFSIDNFGYEKFFNSYIKYYDEISIVHFYGADLKKDYEPKDVAGIKDLKLLKDYIESKEDLVLNNLEFIIKDEMRVGFNDNFTITITSKSNDFWSVQLKPLLEYFGYGESLKQCLIENAGKYVAIGKHNQVQAVFDTFDDFLKSEYTADPPAFSDVAHPKSNTK